MKSCQLEVRHSLGRKSGGAELYTAPPPPTQGCIIGVDCHPDTYTAAVYRGMTPHDACKLGSRQNLTLERLLEWVAKEFSHQDLFLMEAGANSFEVAKRLRALGLRAVVLESAFVGKHSKTYADNDKMAASRIALVYLAGGAPCVWIPDALSSERRELLHAHQNAVSGHVMATNSLKSYLNQFTIRLGKRGLSDERTRKWILQQREWSPLQQELLSGYFQELDHAAERRKGLHRLIAQQVCSDPLMLRCMKLLGIGVINAFALLAVIGEVRRFDRPEKLVAYIGLNPGQKQSGRSKKIIIGVGRRGRGDIRSLLIQGAHALMRLGKATPLGAWGWKLFARKGNRNTAVAAVARKLLVQVWHLLSGNPPTMLEPDKSLRLKLHKLVVFLGKELRAEMELPENAAACIMELYGRMLASPGESS